MERLEQTLADVNQFGFTEEGINRLAYTESEQQAVKYMVKLFEAEGMDVKIDAVGNVIARREGTDPNLPAVVTGSHIDTVYNGGKYDGTLGVVAGLEVIRSLNEQKIETKHPIEVIIFACEESARFGASTIGSMAMIGQFNEEYLTLVDVDGISLQTAMENCGLDVKHIGQASRKKEEIKVFYELHIEQGPVLENENKQIGIATGIAAPTRYHLEIYGEAAHSGTTPMVLRKDALLGAAEIALSLEDAAHHEKAHETVATIGTCEVIAGAMNVVPGKVELAVDIRSISKQSKENVVAVLKETMKEVERKRSLKIDVMELCDDQPIQLNQDIVQSLVESCETLDLTYHKLPSGAGHDAMMMAKVFPTGLIFVPSKDGLSHNKEEFTPIEQIVAGVTLLQEAMLKEAIVEKVHDVRSE